MNEFKKLNNKTQHFILYLIKHMVLEQNNESSITKENF